MKKLLVLALTMVLVSCVSYGQITLLKPTEKITIGKVAGFGYFIAELSYTKGEGENEYVLMFKDAKYKQITEIKSISFIGNEEMINGLYGVLKELIDGKSGDYKEFEIGDEFVKAKCNNILGGKSLTIFGTVNGAVGYFHLSKPQLDTLFGK